MFRLNSLFLIFLLLAQSLRSQEDICIGRPQVLTSEVLGEERTCWVHLPDGYGAEGISQRYPVLYLLDGEAFFHVMVGISRTLSTTKGKHLPPCIIVGILSKDRTHDFTPTVSCFGRDGKVQPGVVPQGGGSEAFFHFLTDELRPYIDSLYHTNGQNMLVGHSYAGLFTLDVFLRHAGSFDVYLALDPSLWWDNGRLAREATTLISKQDYTGKRLYIGIASKKRTDRVDIHLATVNRFLASLSQVPNLQFYHKSFPDENHGSVSIPGFYDGIKQLFAQ